MKERQLKRQFTAPEASELSGVGYTSLVYWDRVNLLQPSIQKSSGTGRAPRLYSRMDVLAIVLIDRMREAGAGVTGLRGTPNLLAELMGEYKTLDDIHSGQYLVSNGRSVDLLTTRELQAVAVLPGKVTKQYIVDVIDAWKRLKRDIREMEREKAVAN